tara:strand:- start:138 stop:251 length:114 start_codon:yes stop_codon:yes gene_type:complete
MLFFGLAHNLQKKYDCEQYAIIDIANGISGNIYVTKL